MTSRSLPVWWLGRQAYVPVLELQRRLFAARQRGESEDVALFVEHPPVVTLGRGAKAEHLLASAGTLQHLGIDVARVERGGDVTLHAPGQLVCYPILDLRPDRCDVRRYVNGLTEAMCRVLGDYGVQAGSVPGMVGTWVDAAEPKRWAGVAQARSLAKVGAVGVRISRWVTMHGYALNLSTDLGLFRHIVPCGIRQYPVTSLAALVGAAPAISEVLPSASAHLARALGMDQGPLSDLSGSTVDALGR